jgi:acyl-CoA dehydrogenase
VAESDNIVAETAEKIFADLADAQTINRDNKGAWKVPLWQALTEAGLPLSWVDEDCGGSGASLAEGFSVLSAAGRFAVAVPLAETMLAGWLLAQARIASPDGEMTVVPASPKDRITVNTDGSLSGKARGVPFAKAAKHFAVLASDAKGSVSIALVDAGKCRIETGLGLGGDQSDIVTLDKVQPLTIKPAPAGFDQTRLMLMGGVARSLQIAGALESMLEISVRYSNERVAFEKKISKFQAVQHNLARLAGESRKAAPLPIKCMARSASPSSTSCIAIRCARWPGATISVPKATGRSSSASSYATAAPMNCGRWWPRADINTDLPA